jgi:hypothetical protein
MLARILPGIVIYGAVAVFVYLLARISIRYEMSKHLDPPYHVALPFLKTMYFLAAVADVLMVVVGAFLLHVP